MATAYKYRVWCSTDSKYVEIWAESAPTECPENGAHSIDSTKTAIVGVSTEDHPLALDGKPYVTPDLFASGTRMQWLGRGDDASLGRAKGTRFFFRENTGITGTNGSTSASATRQFTSTGSFADAEPEDLLVISGGSGDDGTYEIVTVNSDDTVTVDQDWPTGSLSSLTFLGPKNVSKTFSFNDWLELAGGACSVENAQPGDYVLFEIIAPATPVTPNGSNTGNCDVTSGLITPASGDGAYDVNLSNAIPVPTKVRPTDSPSGYYEWSKPDEGSGTVTKGTAGSSEYNLYNADVTLAVHAACKTLMGDDCHNLVVPAIKPATLLPHWNLKVTLHNSGHSGSLKFSWNLLGARIKTD